MRIQVSRPQNLNVRSRTILMMVLGSLVAGKLKTSRMKYRPVEIHWVILPG